MMKVIAFPIAVLSNNYEFEEELNKRIKQQVALEAQGLEDLDAALNEGWTIAHAIETQVNRCAYLRYTMHKAAAPKTRRKKEMGVS